jgi:cytidyltransferase-like protein
MTTVAVSGGFDPLHKGHIRLFRGAAELGRVIVILNTDEWLKRKKGYVFQNYEERAEIILSIRHVDEVVKAIDDDGTVCKTLERLGVDIFANGGDRIESNTPEKELCEKYGIEMVYGVGGDKVQSSSKLVSSAKCV